MEKPQAQNLIVKRYFLTPKDLFHFFGSIITTQRGAQKHYRAIADAIGKTPGQRITLREFAAVEGIPYEDVVEVINRIG